MKSIREFFLPYQLEWIQLAHLLNHFCRKMAAPRCNTSALGPGSHEARLLQLKKQMDEIRAVLGRA